MRYLVQWIKAFFCKHEVEYLEELNILAKGQCIKCKMIMCCNKERGTCLPWDASWDFEFQRMAAWDKTTLSERK